MSMDDETEERPPVVAVAKQDMALGFAAAGAYLQEVRHLRKLPRHRVAARLGISDDQIQRFEKGRNAMNGPALLRLIQAVGASYDEVTRLLEGVAGGVEEARRMARAWVARSTTTPDPALDHETAALYAIALQRTHGDRAAARRLLLRALDEALDD